ncbi:MAG: ATP-binding protein, partial [Chloroflexota bacterium]
HAENLMRKQHARIQQNVADLAKANVEVAKAARLKSEFLSTMSHELRTPLNAIIGYSGIITSGIAGEVNPKANNMVKRISDSGQHLLMLINNVLDISKIEAGRMTIVKDKTYVADMTASVAEQLQVLADDKNLHLDIHIDDTVPKLLMLDSERVKQILINLLSNGIKFTDVGTVSLGLAWEANTLTMKVSDTGVGIPPHAQDVIFDEFRQIDGSSTRTHQGTGLGLAIVRKFTEAMDGSVSLKSRVGEGSTFTVVLPAESVQQAMPQAV